MAPYGQDLNKSSSDEQSVSLIIITDTFLVKIVGAQNSVPKNQIMTSNSVLVHSRLKCLGGVPVL